MPPFRLQGPDRLPTHSRKPQIIYTKNLYDKRVKVEHWQDGMEQQPIDVDPLCQGKVNHFLSHYHRLGISGDEGFKTTTQDMLEQVFIPDKMVTTKLMKNYYTCNDNNECFGDYLEGNCPQICAGEFVTTMQHSYPVPKPYVMKRLAFPKIPFMQNRKYLHERPELSSAKFYDENFKFVTCQLQKHKGFRWSSYDPGTGTYTKVGF